MLEISIRAQSSGTDQTITGTRIIEIEIFRRSGNGDAAMARSWVIAERLDPRRSAVDIITRS